MGATGRGPRTFDPAVIARHETEAWVGYYRREWRTVLRAGIGMVREGFGMGRWRTLRGAYYTMRGTRAWAPVPDNDPAAARDWMRRFYALVIDDQGVDHDPAHAAALEVEWWRLHRERQYGLIDSDAPLVAALVDLYAYVYSAEDRAALVQAATHRVRAMALSDAWVLAGRDTSDPLIAQEYDELLSSYCSLRVAVTR